MKLHSMVDNITNSSSTTYIWPKDGAADRIITLFEEISKVASEKYGIDIDLTSMIEAKVIPNEDWVKDQKWDREYQIKKLKENREKCANMSDSEFEHFMGTQGIPSEEQFEAYISDPKNAVADHDYDSYPLTDLSVVFNGVDISKFFELYSAASTYDG